MGLVRLMGVLLAQLLDQAIADARLPLPGGRGEVAGKIEVGALRAGQGAAALDLSDAAAIASLVDSAAHG